MPSEWVERTISQTVVTNAARGYAFRPDGYSSDPAYGDGSFLSNEFWETATVTNPGANAIRILANNDVGGVSLVATIEPGTHQLIAPGADAYVQICREAYSGWHGEDGLVATLYESDEGVMPATVTLHGTTTDEIEHHYGQDIDATMGPYTWRDGVAEEISDWEAPIEPWLNDNDLFVGAVGVVGTDWDASGVPELGVTMLKLAVYQRTLGGPIAGRYLGSDRRFMGF